MTPLTNRTPPWTWKQSATQPNGQSQAWELYRVTVKIRHTEQRTVFEHASKSRVVHCFSVEQWRKTARHAKLNNKTFCLSFFSFFLFFCGPTTNFLLGGLGVVDQKIGLYVIYCCRAEVNGKSADQNQKHFIKCNNTFKILCRGFSLLLTAKYTASSFQVAELCAKQRGLFWKHTLIIYGL